MTRLNDENDRTRPRVVVVGGGFSGLRVVRQLRRAAVHITLIDRNNYHLFQPLLYQVGTGGLSPANIATPLRAVFGKQHNCEIVLGEVIAIDVESNRVELVDSKIDYDYLVVAAGSATNYFGNQQWEKQSAGLKSLEDALAMRRRIFSAYEAAEQTDDADEREQLMTFVVVGGGPTGVELAGALCEIARHTLKNDYRHIKPEDSRIVLVESHDHVLSQYPLELCQRAERKLAKLGVEVRTNTEVRGIEESGVSVASGEEQEWIAARTVLWAAGVKGNPLGEKLARATGVETLRGGRVEVDRRLRIPGHKRIFVIGDLAAARDEQGEQLPGLAPVAIQQGKYVARVIADAVNGREHNDTFRYRDLGSMATIGRASAIAQIGKLKFAGFFAWILWLVVHLMQVVQVPNRLLIMIQWAWNYFTFNRSARIITQTQGSGAETPVEEHCST